MDYKFTMINYLKRNPYLYIQDILGQMHPLKFKLVDKVLSYLVTINDLILLQLSDVTLSEIFEKCGIISEHYGNALGRLKKSYLY